MASAGANHLDAAEPRTSPISGVGRAGQGKTTWTATSRSTFPSCRLRENLARGLSPRSFCAMPGTHVPAQGRLLAVRWSDRLGGKCG